MPAFLPKLPNNWMPAGRVTARPQPALSADGQETIIADLTTVVGEILPISVRRQDDAATHSEEQLPYTYVPTEIRFTSKLFTLAADDPKDATELNAGAAEVLLAGKSDVHTGPNALAVTGRTQVERLARKWPAKGNSPPQFSGITLEATEVPSGDHIDVYVHAMLALPLGKYGTLGEALNAAGRPPPANAEELAVLEGEYTGRLAENKTLLLPIDSNGALPGRLGVLLTAERLDLGRPGWGPIPQVILDGWVATMPADWRDRLPRQFEHVSRSPGEERQRLEILGTIHEQDAGALLETLEWTDGVSLEALPQRFAKVSQAVDIGSRDALIKVEPQFIEEECAITISSAENIVNKYLEAQHGSEWHRMKIGEAVAILLPESAPLTRSRLLMLRVLRDDSELPPRIVIEQPPVSKPPVRKTKVVAKPDDGWAQNILMSWMREAQPDGTIPRHVLIQLIGELKRRATGKSRPGKGWSLSGLGGAR